MAAFCTHLELSLENTKIKTIDEFMGVFQSSIDDTCKLSVPKTTKRNAISNPWITPGLINCIDKKDKLYKSWKKSTNKKDKGGSPELHEQYKSYRRTLKHLIKSAKQKYFFNEFDKHKNNKKKTWQIINKLRGKSKSNIKSSFIIDNERITCRRIIANKFNEYFVSLAKNLNTSAYNEVPLTSYPSFRTYFSRQCATSIFMEDCDPEEIMNIISEFENGKSSDIPITLIKNAASIKKRQNSRKDKIILHFFIN